MKKNKRTIYELFFKRFFDVILSLLALIILSPLFLIVFILSKIFIHGKAIFAQYRPGKNGKLFKFYKFRSMTNKTDEKGNLLPDNQRITKFGKFLRKTSLDELPQLFNIFKGDMSIVGPRPRLVKDMVFYDKDLFDIYTIRPGLTGLQQVYDRNSKASWDDVFKWDFEYKKRITFFGDIKLLFKTFIALFKNDSISGGTCEGKRDYYYADYLLKNKIITEEQYNLGLEKSEQIIREHSTVSYDETLHNNN